MKCLEAAMREATGKEHGTIISSRGDLTRIEKYFQNHDVGNDYFRLKIGVLGSPFARPALLLMIEPRAGQGEDIEQIQDNHSVYAQAIRSLNPQSQFVKFYVWSDSFEIYLSAKRMAEKQALRGNWIPFPEDEELVENIIGGRVSKPERIIW
jgi:hypothetical protein